MGVGTMGKNLAFVNNIMNKDTKFMKGALKTVLPMVMEKNLILWENRFVKDYGVIIKSKFFI